MFELFIVLL